MGDFIQLGTDGQLVPEDAGTRARLAERAGRFYLAPTSPDILLAVRAPCEGGKSPAPRVVLAGDLSGMPLADMVAFLNQSRMSGVLRVISPGGERAIVFKSGEVRGAASDAPSDRLGEIAVRLGLLARPQLEKFLAGKQTPSNRVGRALVEAGLLQPHDVYRCIQHQVSEIFHAVLLCQEGAFMLVDQPIDDRGALSMNTQGLLMDAIRRIDEMNEFRKRLPSSRAYVVRAKPPKADLDAVERTLYDLCTGDLTVAEIAQAARLGEFEATKGLHHLMEMGLVTTGAERQPAPPPSKRAEVAQVVQVFNAIFREIVTEVGRIGMSAEFLAAATGALASQAAGNRLLAQATFGPDGSLPEETLIHNASELFATDEEGAAALKAALNELMFFLLFETGELLDPAADEDLSRRVKELLGSLEGGT